MTWTVPASFHAKLYVGTDFACAGTLITRRHVLTAAHCPSPVGSYLRLGTLWRSRGLRVTAATYTRHPGYNDMTSASDVAVVGLSRPVTDAEFEAYGLGLVRLNRRPSAPAAGTTALLTGWGFTTEYPGGVPTERLHIAHLKVLGTAFCNDLHRVVQGGLSIDWHQDLCAAGYKRRSCWGDSGGPLWEVSNSPPITFTQFAIVSSAIGSARRPCDSKWPTVLMRTSYYYEWIEEVTGGGLVP